jgi:gamma-butyrobetaine dioxygenase
MPAGEVGAYYRAYRAFGQTLRDPRYILSTFLAPGELVVFDNWRVLHGRTGFASGSPRHLQGCYLDHDGLRSNIAVLEKLLAADERLPHIMDYVESIVQLLRMRGEEAYLGEPVSQLEHALQAAHLASAAGAPDALVVAALLHDLGHLLPSPEETSTIHDEKASSWLAPHFGPEVTEPIRLHVLAKRYLCATDPSYSGVLSPASIESLELQGGPLNAAEIGSFEQNPFHQDAVRLRRWDDAAKIPGLAVPDVARYVSRMRRVAIPSGDRL